MNQDPSSSCYQLVHTNQRLELHNHCSPQMGVVYVDFFLGKNRHRRLYSGGKNQDIVKAVGLSKQTNLHIADLTAGLGRDAFALASLGCQVSLLEHNPMIHALLADGLQRARYQSDADDSFQQAIARMDLQQRQEATSWLQNQAQHNQPDVSYIDVMFPKRKKSALVQKEMQFLQAIETPDPEKEGLLLQQALRYSRQRVVVKRPCKAPPLADQTAHFSITGKNIRYDVYLCKTATKTDQNKK